MTGTILYTLGVALWLGIMIMAGTLPFRPEIVRITRRFVCPPGTELQVETEVYSYHRPGEKAIVIYYIGNDGQLHNVKVKALFVLWGIFSTLSIPVALGIVLLFSSWLAQIGG